MLTWQSKSGRYGFTRQEGESIVLCWYKDEPSHRLDTNDPKIYNDIYLWLRDNQEARKVILLHLTEEDLNQLIKIFAPSP
jgi:hypothetical protein